MRYILTCQTDVSKLEVLSGGNPTMDYKIGEKVVYPNHGVGIIEQINFGVLNGSKPLSFREKKMLERAKFLLVSELATARNTSSENMEGALVKSLAKAKLQMPVIVEKFE